MSEENLKVKDNEPKAPEPGINPYLEHKPMEYGKKFYLSEFLAEKFIQMIAFLSIAVILAIFYFVFNESIYAFIDMRTDKNKLELIKDNHTTQSSQAGDNSSSVDLKPQSYSPDETPSGAENKKTKSDELKPETYTPEGVEPSGDLKPETYTPDGTEPAGELKSETYTPEGMEPLPNLKNTTSDSDAATSSDSGQISAPVETPQSIEYLENQPVQVSDLIMPNDSIEGKPAYIWQPVSQKPKFNVLPLFIGSLKVTLIGLLIAAPLAILAAIFTVSFASKRQKEIIKPIIEILAGFPSVVIGFFALITLATLLQNFFGTVYRLNAFVAGVGIAIAVIPIIYTVAEDSMSFIPKHLKEASLSLGASKWQTASRVILPAAIPGIFAAVILGFGRAFGETMIVLMATGNAALMSLDIFQPVRTLSATIGAEMAEVEFRGVHYGVLFLIGGLLFIITFSLNAFAEFYVKKKLIKRIQGK